MRSAANTRASPARCCVSPGSSAEQFNEPPLLLFACGGLLRLPLPSRISWLLLWLLLTGFTGAVRFGLRDVLLSLQNKPRHPLTRVAIYGAGAAGV